MGCEAARVARSSDLAPTLERALALKGASLVEVMVDSSVPLLYEKRN